jgi:hypothetical protein
MPRPSKWLALSHVEGLNTSLSRELSLSSSMSKQIATDKGLNRGVEIFDAVPVNAF